MSRIFVGGAEINPSQLPWFARSQPEMLANLKTAMDAWHEAHREDFVKSGYTNLLDTFDTQEEKHAHIGDRYVRLDVGSSGAWMLEAATGIIYGIQGYGKVDKKKIAGIIGATFDGRILFRDRFRRGRFDNRNGEAVQS